MLIPTVTVLLRLDFGTVNGPAETALLIVSDRPANSSKRSAASSPRRTGVGGQSHQQQVLLGSMQPTHTAGGNAPSGRWRCGPRMARNGCPSITRAVQAHRNAERSRHSRGVVEDGIDDGLAAPSPREGQGWR